jgi:uncharacterized membrane protein YjjP (DUF1212 family)
MSPARRLLVQFARAAHGAGYPAADLEERIIELGTALGLPGVQVSATPTLIEVSVGPIGTQQTVTLRVRPSAVDLDAIAQLDGVVRDVLDGDINTDTALSRVAHIKQNPVRRPWIVVVAAYSLAGAALTPVLGGGWKEVLAGGLVGVVAGAVALPLTRAPRTEPIVGPVAAIAASFCAAVLVHLGLNSAPDLVTLAAIVSFLPGMTLTIGVRELATEHLQSGVANTANAVIQLLGIVFGVTVGKSVAETWFGKIDVQSVQTGFSAPYIIAAVIAGLAFTITLRAQLRSAPLMCSACVLALVANAVGKALLGPDAGVFIAALAVAVTGGLIGYAMRQSTLVFVVPGILMLVPGSIGLHSMLQLLSGQTVNGVQAGVNTLVTALAIAYGLMVAVVILPPRLTRADLRNELRRP